MLINLQGMAPLLQVFDMPASLRFYRDILGFKIVQASAEGDEPDWVMLQLNDIELMLNTAHEKPHRPKAPDLARQQAHQDTSLYFGCPDVENAYLLLKERGLALNPPETTGYGWRALYLNDPDGYLLVFHWPIQDLRTEGESAS